MSKHISLPIGEDNIRSLKIGDEVLISGTMLTARDEAHKWLVKEKPESIAPYLKNNFIYHCGPVIGTNPDGSYRFLAAGPTTSMREEPYEADVIAHYGVRGVIGKGGMGPKTAEALKKYGAVYLHATGGAAPLLAKHAVRVRDVFKLKEFGVPEALWLIEVKDFPALVTMDATGASLHAELLKTSQAKRDELFGLL